MVLPVGFEPTLLWSLAICLCQLGYESIYRLLFHYQLLIGSSYPSLYISKLHGTPGGSRTHNILILSQSSLPVGLPGQKMETGGSAPPHRTLSADLIHNSRIDAISILGFHIWCRRLESNQRPRIFSPLLIPPQLPRHKTSNPKIPTGHSGSFRGERFMGMDPSFLVVPRAGIEPATFGIWVRYSANWVIVVYGAFNQIRTDDLFLTMEALCQLSYEGIHSPNANSESTIICWRRQCFSCYFGKHRTLSSSILESPAKPVSASQHLVTNSWSEDVTFTRCRWYLLRASNPGPSD